MRDVCELCSLCSPDMGCTKLENESCLKEALKNVKPSVTNGEVIKTMFPDATIAIFKTYVLVIEKHCEFHSHVFPLDWWNRKYGE